MAKAADGSGRKGSAISEIQPPMVQAAARGLNTITGADTAWMSPSNPLQATVPDTAGRQYDYAVAANLNLRPRAGEMVSFGDLRALADAYYLVRLAIETRKDQLVKLRWVIKPTDDKKTPDQRCKDLTTFFKRPDQRNGWQDWLRMLMEDLLVIDAPAVYYHENYGDKPYAFEIIDGATIKVLLDQYGRRPLPPDPAYQQNMKGVPTVNYTLKELAYKPRNPRSWKAYGYSPVEQIIMIVNVGLRRTISQLQFYTEGNIPEMIVATPNTWNPDQVKIYQAYWDSLFEGDTGNRRHAKFVPGGMDIHETKSATLTDAFDEWLARVVQYCFSLPATPYLKQVNKGETTNMKEQAEEEGLAPIMIWVEDFINYLIASYWGIDDLEFAFEDEKSIDPLIQAQIDQIYLQTEDGAGNTVLEANEVRAKLGLEARDYAAEALERAKANPANDPKTGLPLPPAAPQEPLPPNGAKPPVPGKPAKPPIAAKVAGNGDLKKKPTAKLSAANVKTAKKLAGAITKHFNKIKPGVIKQVVAAYGKLTKSDGDDVAKEIDLNLDALLTVTAKNLNIAAVRGADTANDNLDALDVTLTDEQIKAMRDAAVGVGDYNAATLIKNIDPTTRDMIAGNIDDALKDGLSTDELAGVLEDSYAFSEGRATTIARTEIARADMDGSMAAYRASSVVTGKKWLLAEDPCPICEENENDDTIGIDELFSSGDDAAPAHPNCECSVVPVIGDDDAEGDEE